MNAKIREIRSVIRISRMWRSIIVCVSERCRDLPSTFPSFATKRSGNVWGKRSISVGINQKWTAMETMTGWF